jgi:exodeoxyribonuclease V gamma subunit
MMHLYSAGSGRLLATRLAAVLEVVPPDPLIPEWLAVPSDGMRRWLSLELARHLGASGPAAGDGIAANIVRAYPGDLRSAVLAVDRPPDQPDPWRIERMVWPVLEAIVEADGAALPTGLTVLENQREGASLYAKSRRIADLFDRYHLYRPHMVRQWSRDRLVDGVGRPLDDHAVWQARLWRRVRDRIDEPSPPERLPELLRRLHAGEELLDLPPRLVLFGFSLLPAGGFLDVARAVASSREVHVFMLEPTHLDPKRLLVASPPPEDGSLRLRSSDATAPLVRHPLLRSWGRLHRETALQLADVQAEGVPVLHVEGPVAAPTTRPASPTTLLGRLQHDIRANRASEATLADDPDDDSVQFHSCFGAIRQVEVLRDALLHLLARPGSDLTEEDIVVLCPALDRFAPLIEAAFGRSAPATTAPSGATSVSVQPSLIGRHGAPALRYRLADRSIRTTNPVLSATSDLLQLVAGRFDVDGVLEFMALAPVRERFGFDDDTLGVISEWVEATNVRWGLDPSQRERLGLPGSVVTNTWEAAVERLLVGSAVFDEDLGLALGDVAPYGVEGGDVEIVGHLAAVIGCLADLADEASTARPLAVWVERIGQTCAALFATERDQGWQLEALERILGEIVDSSERGEEASTVALEFGDVWKLLDERLDDKVGRADFFRGGITVTSLTPLRWVPFRVVCLLGMDQSAFGAEGSAGDDLSATVPLLGDRDPRGEARETLLEAVLAAEEHLVVVREGHDVRTNQPVPRAVPTTELYESLLGSVATEARVEVARRLEIDHPRQSYDERCFETGRLVAGTPWGFDRDELAGAVARRSQARWVPPFLEEPLEPLPSDVIELSDLHRFMRNPTAAFFSTRLEARLPLPEDDRPTALAVDIAGLNGWAVGSRLLEARQAGRSFEEWLRYERQLGTLPPSPLGDRQLEVLHQTVQTMLDAAHDAGMGSGPARPCPVDAWLPDGTRVVGSVPLRLRGDDGGSGPAALYYSKFKPSHRVAAWLDLMALVVTDPGRQWRSLAVSRPDRTGADPTVNDLVLSSTGDEGSAAASAGLAVAVDCYRRGMTEPLTLFPTFSWHLYRGKSPRGHWHGYPFPEDGDHPAVRLAFGNQDFDGITGLASRPTDPRGGKGRAMRFATYLHRTVDQSTASRPGRDGEQTRGSGS